MLDWLLIGAGYVGLIAGMRWMGRYSERRRDEIRRGSIL